MALRAGSVGLGREAGLGARRGWTRRRRPLPRPGRPPVLSARARPPLFPAGPRRPPRRRHLSSPLLLPVGGRVGGRRAARAPGRRVQPRGGSGAGGTSGPPVGRGARTLGGAGGGGDSGREPGPSRGSPQLRRASRPLPGSPAGAGAGPLPAGPRSTPPSPLPRCVAGAGGRVPRVWGEPPRRCSPAGSAPRAAVFRAAPRLGRRLAADLELVRTRGIRLFN